MSDSNSQADQSMEEILQSIKRIIADDEESDQKARTEASASGSDDGDEAAGDSPVAGSDLLELKDIVESGAESPEAAASAESGAGADPAVSDTPQGNDVMQVLDDALNQSDHAAEAPSSAQEKESASDELPLHHSDNAKGDVLEDIDSLLTEETTKATSEAFASLKQKEAQTEAQEAPADAMALSFRSGHTLEDLVVEALKPELRQWLNANLPAIVERIVASEVQKITNQS